MKKKSFIILIGIIVILCLTLTALFLVNKANKKEVEIVDYVVHYYTGIYVYDVNIKDDTMYVEKNEVVMCIQAPCDPIKVDSFKIKFKEEYQELIDNLFKDKNTKEITITNNDLSDEEIKIISSIVKEKIKEGNAITYDIIDSSQYNGSYSKRGYYIENSDNGKVIVTVAMGTQSTGGYNISVVKVNIIDGGVQIYVEETSPSKDVIVTDAITYPIIQIEFNQMPEYVLVQNLDTFQNFEEINID